MQDRYVGDIGDFIKLAILRCLAPGRRVGVAWWLFLDNTRNGDGRHTKYLSRPSEWRHYDPELFDKLADIISNGKRDVQSLEASGILSSALFASDAIPTDGPPGLRSAQRARWFEDVRIRLIDCNLLFIDPDNGLEPDGYKPDTAKAGKSVTLTELSALQAPGRCIIVYHHQSRRAGGHSEEILHYTKRLRGVGFKRVDALRAKPYSPRAFFVLDASRDIRERAETLATRWKGLIEWMPEGKKADTLQPGNSGAHAHAGILLDDSTHPSPVIANPMDHVASEDLNHWREELRIALAAFVKLKMTSHVGVDWEEREMRTPGVKIKRTLDTQALLGIVLRNWGQIFSRYLDRSVRFHAELLRDFRNRVAHEEPISLDDMQRAFDNAERLLAAIGASDGAERLCRRREAMLSRRFNRGIPIQSAEAAPDSTSRTKPAKEIFPPPPRSMNVTPEQHAAYSSNPENMAWKRWMDEQICINGKMDLKRLYALAQQYGIEKRYDGTTPGQQTLNPGQQRMNIGNMLKSRVPAALWQKPKS
jgi:hypothetical protein